jgi:hypothetical protein
MHVSSVLQEAEGGQALLAMTEPNEPFTGSAMDWVLKKADQSLDDIEENPPAYAKALYKVSTGPVGALEIPV